MATKSILVHLDDDPGHRDRLGLGIDLANRLRAHLDVVYVTPRVHPPAGAIGRAASLEFIAEAREAALAKAARIEKEVEELCTQLLSCSWHVEEGDPEKIVARFAHLADLVIVGRIRQSLLEDLLTTDLVEPLLFDAGCPLLIVPDDWRTVPFPKRVLVAWKNSREAIAATRGGLALLGMAEAVLILAAEDEDLKAKPGADLVRYLAYHDIDATVIGTSRRGGEDIVETAETERCDLIVMGGLTRDRRLAERLFGGSTEYVLRESTVPVLMGR
jgi:nucleotide-binding universal stress UspA family protein